MKRFFVMMLLLFATATSASATSWAYPFVVYEDSIYVTTEESVTEVGEKLDEVTSYSDMDSLSGNFSNIYEVGTEYYEIVGVDPSEAIAVKTDDGYVRAYFEAPDYEPSGVVEKIKDIVDPIDEPIEVIGGGGFMWIVLGIVVIVLVLVFFARRGDRSR